MSGPELENGYTRIANELFEAITRAPFSKVEVKVLHVIIRKTYGYNKKKDVISLSQFRQLTGTAIANISRAIKNLADKNVILINKSSFGKEYELNKHYTEWDYLAIGNLPTPIGKLPIAKHQSAIGNLPTPLLAKQQIAIGKTTNPLLANCQPQKTKTKDTLKTGLKTKRNKKENVIDEIEMRFNLFWDCYPKKVGRKKAFEKWTKLNPSEILLDEIIKSVETIKLFKWDHTEPKFIPDPATWIFQERWHDQVFDERDNSGFDKPRSVVDRIQQQNDLADERERLKFEKSTGRIFDAELD